MPRSLERSLAGLLAHLHHSQDLHVRRLTITSGPRARAAALVYLRDIVDQAAIRDGLLRPLLSETSWKKDAPRISLQLLQERAITLSHVDRVGDYVAAGEALLAGAALLFLEGEGQTLAVGVKQWKTRGIEKSSTENSVRGPHEGLNEDLYTVIAQVRKRVKNHSLVVRETTVGRRSRTRVAVMYIADLAAPALIRDVMKRLAAVDFEGVQCAERLIDHMTFRRALFPLLLKTERPDTAAAALVQGKLCLISEGAAHIALIPSTMTDFFRTADDYYLPPAAATFLRLVRAIGFAAAMYLSALYVAVATYHPDVLRTEMALAWAGSRSGVPLTAVAEIVFLEFALELFTEATVRLPSPIGVAATVVAGVIIGQAATQARLVSNLVIVVVAVSAVGAWSIPYYEMSLAWRTAKWITIAAASVLGIFGVFVASFALLVHLNGLESFSTPYLWPLSPLRPAIYTTLFRAPSPIWHRRFSVARPRDPTRVPAKEAQTDTHLRRREDDQL